MAPSWLGTPVKPLGVRTGNDTSGVPDLLHLLQRPLVISVAPRLGPACYLCRWLWSVERPWALTYHCPLLADGHKHILAPLSSPCAFWVLIPLEERKSQESGGVGPRPAPSKQGPRAICGCRALKIHPVLTETCKWTHWVLKTC